MTTKRNVTRDDVLLHSNKANPVEGKRKQKSVLQSRKGSGQRTGLPRIFPRTDAGNAELFAHLYKDGLRYDHARDRWLVWCEHWWTEDEDEEVYRRAKAAARYRVQAANGFKEEKTREKEIKWATTSESRTRLEAALRLAKTERPLADTGIDWDSDRWLLGVANGVIELPTSKLREGRPSDKITLHTDIPFDREAQCPRWIQFLEEIFGGDRELIDFVHRAVGYSLTGKTEEQCLFYCYGVGANGKSTFLKIVRFVLGHYAYNLPFSAFELKGRSSIPNDIAALDGRRFVTAIETNESVQLNEGRIKALTGCDPVTARYLFREFITFVPVSKIWLAFNHKPRVADDSPGFWRRIRLIPFLKEFKEEADDQGLEPKLQAEAQGILAWAMRGCLEWQEKGLGMPAVVREATQAYRKENDPLDDFITECCIVDPSVWTTASAIWKDYQRWAVQSGEDRRIDRRTFSRLLQARGFRKERYGHKRTWTWFGISLRPDLLDMRPQPGAVVRTDADVKSDIVVNPLVSTN